jgi:hypothetical protein
MSKARIEGHEVGIGKGDHAGMPKDVYMQDYPKSARLTMNEGIDDSMTDIDNVDGRAEGKRRKFLSNQK